MQRQEGVRKYNWVNWVKLTQSVICILQVPDYSHVYGITGSQTAYPDTTSVTATSSQDTDILENKRRFVKEYASYHRMDYFF